MPTIIIQLLITVELPLNSSQPFPPITFRVITNYTWVTCLAFNDCTVIQAKYNLLPQHRNNTVRFETIWVLSRINFYISSPDEKIGTSCFTA